MSNWRQNKTLHVVLVLTVFTCTGFTVAWLGRQIVEALGFERFSLEYWLMWIFAMLPIYNVIILGYAFIFGKYTFFRNKQKKTWKRMKGWFGGQSKSDGSA
ncbi:MAG: DUF6787 family protein [Bacteroidota bacterium]